MLRTSTTQNVDTDMEDQEDQGRQAGNSSHLERLRLLLRAARLRLQMERNREAQEPHPVLSVLFGEAQGGVGGRAEDRLAGRLHQLVACANTSPVLLSNS